MRTVNIINNILNAYRMEQKTNEQRSFTYTAPYSDTHVSADLSAMAMLFIELMCQQQEQSKSYGELIRTKDALAQFGFKNSQNAKLLGAMTGQMAEYKEATNTLAFMEEVWQKFGADAMVVRYDHFFQILEKYDMVCGSFDRYTGGIPQSALDTLTRLNGMWEREELERKYALGLNYAGRLTFKDEMTGIEAMKKRLRMPLRVNDKSVAAAISACVGIDIDAMENDDNHDTLTDVLFIAAPAADMKPLEMDVEFETDKLKELRKAHPKTKRVSLGWVYPITTALSYKEKQAREAEYDRVENIRRKEIEDINRAVRDEEERLQAILANSDINRYAKISFIHKEAEIVRILKDPFICSLTPYGVLIHAKWGAEAEDATIKRYEQLRDAIIGKGGVI